MNDNKYNNILKYSIGKLFNIFFFNINDNKNKKKAFILNYNIETKNIRNKYRKDEFCIGALKYNNNTSTLFHKSFAIENHKKIKLIINNKEKQMIFKVIQENKYEKEIKIKIKIIDKNINFKNMFYDCKNLKSIYYLINFNRNKIIDMNAMFYNCKSLVSLPDISKWNTNNVTDMNAIFYNCESLVSLPDISKWNTNNVTDMNRMFSSCETLISLPDISKWNTNNVEDISGMFFFVNH